MTGIALEDNCHLLSGFPFRFSGGPFKGGRSPRITRFGSNWQTDRTHRGVLQARRWAGPKKTSAEFEDQECKSVGQGPSQFPVESPNRKRSPPQDPQSPVI